MFEPQILVRSSRAAFSFPHSPSRVHPKLPYHDYFCMACPGCAQKSRHNEASMLHLHKIQTATHHEVTHRSIFIFSIGGDDDIDGLDNTLESLEKVFRFKLQLQQGTVHLVHHQDWLDTFTNGLTEHCLSLHTNTWQ